MNIKFRKGMKVISRANTTHTILEIVHVLKTGVAIAVYNGNEAYVTISEPEWYDLVESTYEGQIWQNKHNTDSLVVVREIGDVYIVVTFGSENQLSYKPFPKKEFYRLYEPHQEPLKIKRVLFEINDHTLIEASDETLKRYLTEKF